MRNGVRAAGLTAIAATLALAAPTQAAAPFKAFAGKTSQQRDVTLRMNADGTLDRLRIAWKADTCAVDGTWYRGRTITEGPLRHSDVAGFRDAGAYRERSRGGYVATIRAEVVGTHKVDPAAPRAEAWSGTFAATVTVRRRGRVIDRCTTGTLFWEVAPR